MPDLSTLASLSLVSVREPLLEEILSTTKALIMALVRQDD